MDYYYKLETLDLTRPRVRCNGRALDKCSLSSLIHEVALRSGWDAFPLVSDIYWDTMTYAELRAKLEVFYMAYCHGLTLR